MDLTNQLNATTTQRWRFYAPPTLQGPITMTTKPKPNATILKHPHQTTAKPYYTLETLTAMRDYHHAQVNHLEAVETRTLKALYDCRQQLRYHTQQALALQDQMGKR